MVHVLQVARLCLQCCVTRSGWVLNSGFSRIATTQALECRQGTPLHTAIVEQTSSSTAARGFHRMEQQMGTESTFGSKNECVGILFARHICTSACHHECGISPATPMQDNLRYAAWKHDVTDAMRRFWPRQIHLRLGDPAMQMIRRDGNAHFP